MTTAMRSRFPCVTLNAGVLHREWAAAHPVVDEGVHLLDVFFRDVEGGIEALHLARDADGEYGRRRTA